MALNERTPTEILDDLAADEMMDYDYTLNKNRYLVKEAVARNPKVAHKTGDEHIRASAASNPGIKPDLLAKLSKDPSWLVRDRIARNDATPESLLYYLSFDRIMDVRVSERQDTSCGFGLSRLGQELGSSGGGFQESRPR